MRIYGLRFRLVFNDYLFVCLSARDAKKRVQQTAIKSVRSHFLSPKWPLCCVLKGWPIFVCYDVELLSLTWHGVWCPQRLVWNLLELDREAPLITDRPSTVHLFSQNKKHIFIYIVTPATWHLTPDSWHVTLHMWHMVNILSKFQLPISYGLGFMML